MNSIKNSILVPIDATHQSVVALNQSYNLARLTNATIVLMSVDEGKSRVDTKSRLDELAREAKLVSGVSVETIIRKGNVDEEIAAVADQIKPLFILMGVISKSSKETVSGKNAFKVIRKSNYPVISVKGKVHSKGCKTIVLPLDLTRETREKVNKGIELAKLFNARIHVISVLTSKDQLAESRLTAYSHQVIDYITSKGISVVLKTVVSNDIANSVLLYSQAVQADLIVVMSKYELNLIEYFIGTTAERLINQSYIPVLSLRPKVKRDTSVFVPY